MGDVAFKSGRLLGFLAAEMVFATMFFFALSLTHKIAFGFSTYRFFLAAVAVVFAVYFVFKVRD